MAFAFTVGIDDSAGLGAATDGLLSEAVSYAAAEWSRYIAGLGTLEIQVNVTATPAGTSDGGATAVASDGTLDGRYLEEPASVLELNTGSHVAGAASDITIDIDPTYLTQSVWLDPDPGNHALTVPARRLDAVSVMRHEIGHGLGIGGYTTPTGMLGSYETEWDHYLRTNADGSVDFVGPAALAVYGPVPITTLDNGEGYAHVGNSVSGPLGQDLMNGVAFDYGTTYDISSVDLALEQDVGEPVTALAPGAAPVLSTGAAGGTLLGSDSATLLGGSGGTVFQLYGFDAMGFGGAGALTVEDRGFDATVVGGMGPETVFAGTNALYYLSSSNGLYVGGAGSDTVVGGAGSSVVYEGAGAAVAVGGAGSMFFVGSAAGGAVLSGSGVSGLYGAAGGALSLFGSSSGNFYVAGSGNETLNGGSSTGNNDFFLGSGADVVTAGSGNDGFLLGSGSATLTGGAGANIYYIVNGTAGRHDLITDFNAKAGDQLSILNTPMPPTTTVAGTSTIVTLPDNSQITLAAYLGPLV